MTLRHFVFCFLLSFFLSSGHSALPVTRLLPAYGTAVVDGIAAVDFAGQLKAEWEAVKTKLKAGSYGPQAVKRVTIPKPNRANAGSVSRRIWTG